MLVSGVRTLPTDLWTDQVLIFWAFPREINRVLSVDSTRRSAGQPLTLTRACTAGSLSPRF